MSHRVMVSGACQAPTMAYILRVLLPEHDIQYLPLPEEGGPEEPFRSAIAVCDMWLTSDWEEAARLSVQDINPGMVVQNWPTIYFSGFHPDITYAFYNGAHITSMGCVYNSAIVLWCYLNGVSELDAARLFNPVTFESLGYLAAWDLSVQELRAKFALCDLNFQEFYMPIKRTGLFMHSHLHPTVPPMVNLARMIAKKVGLEGDCISAPLERVMQDHFALDAVWPVYPGIADLLGIAPSYVWKYRDAYCYGLEAYISTSYASYGSQPVHKESIVCERLVGSLYDTVLSSQL